MSDDLDPGLKRLFALTAEHPADDVFVAQVTARTSRERLASTLLRGLGLALALAVGVAVLASPLGLAANQAAATFSQVAASFTAAPFGWICGLSLVFAGAVCWRALSQLAAGWRK